MRIGTILVISGVFGLMIALVWRTFATDRGGLARDGEAIVPPTGERRDVAN